MRTHTAIHTTIAMLLAGPLACGEEQVPETRIWLAGQREPTSSQDKPLACKLAGVTDNQGVVIRHELPEEVETDLPVQIFAETPCSSVAATMKHNRTIGVDDDGNEIAQGVAQATIVAPAGAACSLTITVEIANDRHICSSRDEKDDADNATDPACTDLDKTCAAALGDGS